MRVLITGGAGFIGSHIVDALLAHAHEPFVIDNLSSGCRENLPEKVPLYVADICDAQRMEQIFQEVKPEAVCHQAAQMSVSRSMREPVFDAEVNILGLLRVLDLSVRNGVQRVVFASSGGALYGDVYEPVPETHPCEPFSPYGISKWVGEQYLKFYSREYPLKAVALRYSNVYGPRQNPHGEAGVVAIFSQKMLAAQQATIFGDGLIVRDYVFVEDVARANRLALERDLAVPFVPLNVGTGVGTDVNTLASRLQEFAAESRQRSGESPAPPLPLHAEPRAGDLRSSLISPARARTVLGWSPSMPLADGLKKTIDWFAGHRAGGATPA